ncbi:hypothetical protein D4D24_05825 [Listeria monocytogenes]|nr:hypothetical protein [Listeria monocytogenes]EAE2917310.1 hypothetical protein [Listeria monocytogenes]EAE4064424.1 hypothetical protein [Listeria monocytogenes]EAE5215639.1 hypothetical protein [Listeria monocytogenes]EAE5419422.1 hypothetical protein [Listeria monocytogenes]
MKRNKCISYYFLIKRTAETFFSWLIYSHKLTTSKTFSFFPLFRMKIPNTLFDQCGLLPFSTLVFFMPKNEKKNRKIS